MGIRGVAHAERVVELVEKFKVWRKQRLPGVRAFQSTYDRCVAGALFVIVQTDV